MGRKVVFVTVGTTKFDSLISKITELDVLNTLKLKGYNDLVIQIGNGKNIPNEENAKTAEINLSYYRFKDTIKSDILKSDLVISHAGAGTCLEVLGEKKPLLVVVNEDLMNNHQTELANQLSSDGYLFACTCDSLIDAITCLDVKKLREIPEPEPQMFSNYLNKFMGFQD